MLDGDLARLYGVETKALKYTYQMPYGFTEQGVAMLASVLKSETAVKVSIRIIELRQISSLQPDNKIII